MDREVLGRVKNLPVFCSRSAKEPWALRQYVSRGKRLILGGDLKQRRKLRETYEGRFRKVVRNTLDVHMFSKGAPDSRHWRRLSLETCRQFDAKVTQVTKSLRGGSKQREKSSSSVKEE